MEILVQIPAGQRWWRPVARCLAVAVVATATAACGASADSDATTAKINTNVAAPSICVDQWNGPDNSNRQALARSELTVGEVSQYVEYGDSITGGSEQPADQETHGCGYLFHNASDYQSFTGRWEGSGQFSWDSQASGRGTWTAQQQAITHDNVRVNADGTITPR